MAWQARADVMVRRRKSAPAWVRIEERSDCLLGVIEEAFYRVAEEADSATMAEGDTRPAVLVVLTIQCVSVAATEEVDPEIGSKEQHRKADREWVRTQYHSPLAAELPGTKGAPCLTEKGCNDATRPADGMCPHSVTRCPSNCPGVTFLRRGRGLSFYPSEIVDDRGDSHPLLPVEEGPEGGDE